MGLRMLGSPEVHVWYLSFFFFQCVCGGGGGCSGSRILQEITAYMLGTLYGTMLYNTTVVYTVTNLDQTSSSLCSSESAQTS